MVGRHSALSLANQLAQLKFLALKRTELLSQIFKTFLKIAPFF